MYKQKRRLTRFFSVLMACALLWLGAPAQRMLAVEDSGTGDEDGVTVDEGNVLDLSEKREGSYPLGGGTVTVSISEDGSPILKMDNTGSSKTEIVLGAGTWIIEQKEVNHVAFTLNPGAQLVIPENTDVALLDVKGGNGSNTGVRNNGRLKLLPTAKCLSSGDFLIEDKGELWIETTVDTEIEKIDLSRSFGYNDAHHLVFTGNGTLNIMEGIIMGVDNDTMTVQDGAKVVITGMNITIGGSGGVKGTLTVTGDGSTLTLVQGANFGVGKVNVTKGGKLSAEHLFMNGELNIDEESELEITSELALFASSDDQNAKFEAQIEPYLPADCYIGTWENNGFSYFAVLDKKTNNPPANGLTVTRLLSIKDAEVTLNPASFVYDGTEKEPDVTVTVNGRILILGRNYTLSYEKNISAGTAAVTVHGALAGEETKKNFTIEKAAPVIAWNPSSQTVTYNGGQVKITGPTVTLKNNEEFHGTVSYSYSREGESTYREGLPTDAGTYNVKAGLAEQDNYTAAESDTMTLTITKADGILEIPEDPVSKTFGDAAFPLSDLDIKTNNPEAAIQYTVTKGEDVVSLDNDKVIIKNAGRAVITVSVPESADYHAVSGEIPVIVKKGSYKGNPISINRSHFYAMETTADLNLADVLPEDCGTVTYGTPSVSGEVSIKETAVNDGILSYTVESGNIGAEGIVTVVAETQNYEDIEVTVNVKLISQIPVRPKKDTEVTLKNANITFGETLSKLVFEEVGFVGDDGKAVTGTLAWKNEEEKPRAGSHSAAWIFTPTNTEYASAEGELMIQVDQARPVVFILPAVAERAYSASGVLKDSDLSGGIVIGVDGNVLEGAWSWQSKDIVPTVGKSGYTAIFKPADEADYETVTKNITVAVTKAKIYIAVLPAAGEITYGDSLSASVLSGGIVQYDSRTGQEGDKGRSSTAVEGTFSWKEPSIKPAAADSNATEYEIVFTPVDGENHYSAEATVKLTVRKAQNAPNMPGSVMNVANSIDKVNAVILPAGWEWQVSDGDIALETGAEINAVAIYTGADKGNYENETVTVSITRSACEHTHTEVRDLCSATCTIDGYSGDTYCVDCGAMTQTGTVIPALGHDYTSEVTKEPTADSEGTRTYTCARCGEQHTEPVSRLQKKQNGTEAAGNGNVVKSPSTGQEESGWFFELGILFLAGVGSIWCLTGYFVWCNCHNP